MTTSTISPSFNYIRPIFFLRDGTRYQGGIENTDRTLAILEPCKTVAKVATFQVVRHDRSEVIECHNLASARAYAEGRAPELRPSKEPKTLPVWAFRSPSGQYYVKTRLSGVRIDCANQQTARYYFKNGVCPTIVADALISEVK